MLAEDTICYSSRKPLTDTGRVQAVMMNYTGELADDDGTTMMDYIRRPDGGADDEDSGWIMLRYVTVILMIVHRGGCTCDIVVGECKTKKLAKTELTHQVCA